MLLYSLNELFQVFKEVGVNDINRQCIVAHKIVSLASLHCTEQRGKHIDSCKTRWTVYTWVDVHDEKGLEQLAWAIYDGVILPGDFPELQGEHDWA